MVFKLISVSNLPDARPGEKAGEVPGLGNFGGETEADLRRDLFWEFNHYYRQLPTAEEYSLNPFSVF